MTSNKLFCVPYFLWKHIILKSQWLKTMAYFLLVLHGHCLSRGTLLCVSLLQECGWGNSHHLIIKYCWSLEGKKILEGLTPTIKCFGLQVTHIIISVHNLLPRTSLNHRGPERVFVLCAWKMESQKCWAHSTYSHT